MGLVILYPNSVAAVFLEITPFLYNTYNFLSFKFVFSGQVYLQGLFGSIFSTKFIIGS